MSLFLKVDPHASLKCHQKLVREIINDGGVIAFQTDTYYGLGANPFNKKAIRRIFEIKSRQSSKPLLLLISVQGQLGELAHNISREANQLMNHFWPAPLTLVFNAVSTLPDILTAKTGKVGVRLPGNEWTRRLIKTAGSPLTATSANKENGENPKTAQEVLNTFGSRVDLIIDSGPAPGGQVSTLLDTTVSPPNFLRHGVITKKEIASCITSECNVVS
jgi:L-threonylcarbamoyladenylate synthase